VQLCGVTLTTERERRVICEIKEKRQKFAACFWTITFFLQTTENIIFKKRSFICGKPPIDGHNFAPQNSFTIFW
jgi:hypothetical protein